MSGPRTTREALIAEMLGDLDGLLARAEALPGQVAASEERVAATVAALDAAGDKYRMAVTAYTDQAKAELAEYLDRKAGEVSARTQDEQRAAMQEAARAAFHTEAAREVMNLVVELRKVANGLRRSPAARIIEHAGTALLASGVTVGLVYLVGRLH